MLTSTPKLAVTSEKVSFIGAATKISGFTDFEAETVKRYGITENRGSAVLKSLSALKPIPEHIKKLISDSSGKQFCDNADGFVITCDGENAVIYADTAEGMGNGVMVYLRALDKSGGFSYSLLWDYPLMSLRGIKLMMPGREEIPAFKEFIDLMAYYRHNTVMIEIGGAMEYKRHPEINEGWVEYAAFMSEYSGKSNKIQNCTYPWRKNSIHSNNGGGSFLLQEEVKELIEYCKSRNVKIIPEVPCTSHCDYMLTRHPELAERPEDPYPDTFCPSNPESYELLFDIFDEVIDVFKPEIINIGHDEYYSINVCDRCRKRLMDASDILAEDLTKIHDYLASKNVKTMFWCDKLLNVLTESGANFGGAINYVYMGWNVKGKFLGVIPATWPARDKIPEDIICLNWFWSFGEEHDEVLRKFPVVFGNFEGCSMIRYRKRCGENTFGGICSNWGGTDDIYFQRNNIYFSLAYNDVLYWDDSFDDTDNWQFSDRADLCFESLYEKRYKGASLVTVVHNTTKSVGYRSFCDGEYPAGEEYERTYTVGEYVITYTDGTVQREKSMLGIDIGNDSLPWYRGNAENRYYSSSASPGRNFIRIDNNIRCVASRAVPMEIDGKIYYKTGFELQYPEKTVGKVEFKLVDGADWTVDIHSIEY